MKSRAKKQSVAIGYVGGGGRRGLRRGAGASAPAADIKAFTRQRGWKLLTTHTEGATTGAGDVRRPALLEAIDDVCRQRAVLVAGEFMELAGSVQGFLQICAQLNKAGAHLVLIQEGIDTTLDGGIFFAWMAALAKLDAQRHAAVPQFGFSLADDGIHVVVNAHQQEVIRQMVAWRWQGLSERAIAARLKSLHVAGPGGKAWSAVAVRAVLASAPTARWDGLAETL